MLDLLNDKPPPEWVSNLPKRHSRNRSDCVKVYVIIWKGDLIHSVYATKVLAEKKQRTLKREHWHTDIQEWEVVGE